MRDEPPTKMLPKRKAMPVTRALRADRTAAIYAQGDSGRAKAASHKRQAPRGGSKTVVAAVKAAATSKTAQNLSRSAKDVRPQKC